MDGMQALRLILTLASVGLAILAQQSAPPDAPPERDHENDRVLKAIDDLMWQLQFRETAFVDKVRYTSAPPRNQPNPAAQGAGNPLILSAYTFIPKDLDRSAKQPLIVLPHGGVHSNFNTSYASVVRELLSQGYSIIAPEYRGSTGYGRGMYRQIDYGGLEIEDVYQGMRWMLSEHSFLDPKRVGIIGWSHGGLITLMNIFEHPGDYAVAYAGVPVSDLVARMGYKGESYEQLYAADYHIGKTARDDVQEYLRRSPVTHAEKLATPLLIHTTTNDEDVNVLEVERLIDALKADGKEFEYKIYRDAPGGHAFNRLDTKLARESRQEVYRFLARYLKPSRPVD
jgi:dipeptidyl aminopeptidase/acylaminoacyl peptidase